MQTLDDLDEATTPFTHAQIGQMLNAAERAPARREYEVDLSYFMGFGDAGTPSGMIGSCYIKVVVGSCGEPAGAGAGSSEEDPYPWGPAPTELSSSSAPRYSAPKVASGPTPAPALPWELPASMEAPLQPPVAGPAQGDALDEDLHNAGLRNHARPIAIGFALLAGALGVLVWWQTRPEPPPPPERGPPERVAVVVTDYEDQDELQGAPQRAGERETGGPVDAGDSGGRVKIGQVGASGPSELTTVPAWKTPRCVTQRERADAALRKGEWAQLERLSKETRCWRRGREAKVLRMHALFELGRLDECRKLGNGATHEDIKTWTNTCTRGGG